MGDNWVWMYAYTYMDMEILVIYDISNILLTFWIFYFNYTRNYTWNYTNYTPYTLTFRIKESRNLGNILVYKDTNILLMFY